MCAALSPTPPNSSTNSSLSNSEEHQLSDQNNSPIDNNSNSRFQQPQFLRSFEAELDKVDEYFQTKAPDVRQAILNSLQSMYNENEWHDNPLTIICRDLDVHVPTSEQLMDLKATRDALKAEYDALRQSLLMDEKIKTDRGDAMPQDLEKKYRLPTESKNQWELRKRFLEKYWDKYDEDRLLCLAQCYVNMRCLGCKYSKSLDSLIEGLAKEIE